MRRYMSAIGAERTLELDYLFGRLCLICDIGQHLMLLVATITH